MRGWCAACVFAAKGRVAEYGPPKELLANDAGVFRSLVEAASAVQSSLDAAPQSSSTVVQ